PLAPHSFPTRRSSDLETTHLGHLEVGDHDVDGRGPQDLFRSLARFGFDHRVPAWLEDLLIRQEDMRFIFNYEDGFRHRLSFPSTDRKSTRLNSSHDQI